MTRHVVLFVGLLFPALCSAQNAQTLSLERCLKLAFEHNLDLITARLNEQRAEVDERSSFGRFLPYCDSGLSCTLQDKAQTSLSGIRGLVRTRESYSLDLSANWGLFSGFGGLADYAAHRHLTRAQRLTYRRTREEVAFSVTQRYVACLRAQQLVNIGREALKRSKAQLEQAEAMFQVGAVPRADVMKQSVQLGNARLALIRSGIELERALSGLFGVMGTDGIPENVRLEDVAADTTEQHITFEHALETAMAHREDLGSAGHLSQAASLQRKVAGSALLPSLSAHASYGFWDAAFPASLKELDRIDTISYGLTLRIPIFDRLQARSELRRAKIAFRESHEQRNSIRRKIAREIRNALNEMVAAKESMVAARQHVEAAREDLTVADENYRLGAAIVLDRITASVQLAEAEANQVNALYDYVLARARLRHATGVYEP